MRKPRIEFADQTVVKALQPFVDRILSVIGEELHLEYIHEAFVTDESCVWCFFPSKETGEVSSEPDIFHPGKMRKIIQVTHDTPENAASLARIQDSLGISVDMDDCIYEVALRLRDKHEGD